MNVDDVLGQLNPKIRKLVTTGDKISIEKQPTPSESLNTALKGGLAYGRQVLLWGTKSSGKSSFCLMMIGLAQKEGKVCAWIDAEQSFDAKWAERLGVDVEKLIYVPVKTVNDMVDAGVQLMEAGTDVVIVDSISALLPAIFFEKKSDELKQLEDTGQIGSEAKAMTAAVKMLNYANENTLLVLISQVRNQFGGMHASHTPTGGMAVQFFSSTVIKLWASNSDVNTIKKNIPIGDKLVERRVGRPVTWDVQYNKTAGQFISGSYDFYFDGDDIGIDTVAEVVDMALERGVIQKGGAWFKYEDFRCQGRQNMIEYVRENSEVFERIKGSINE